MSPRTDSTAEKEVSLPQTGSPSDCQVLTQACRISRLPAVVSQENENENVGSGLAHKRDEMTREGKDLFAGASSGNYTVEDAYSTAVKRCIVAATKGFVIGAGLRGGLSLFAVVARLKRTRLKGGQLLKKSSKKDIITAFKETLRYGFFLGSYAGIFTITDEVIAAIGGSQRTAKWRSLIAGAVAGPSLTLTGQMPHTGMAIYVLMRATVLAARCGIKSKKLGWVCRPLTWKYGDIFLMCLSSSQILSAWILKPESLPSSYFLFLNKHGGKDQCVLEGFRNLALSKSLNISIEAIEKQYKSKGIEIYLDPAMRVPCAMIHGNQHCLIHFFTFLWEACLRSLPVYLPVYIAPALIVHRQGLFKTPLLILRKSLFGTARSSLFLAAYCASSWIWSCIIFRAAGRCTPGLIAAATFPTGIALMIEKKTRRMEIALYCLSRAIESSALCIRDTGYMRRYNISLLKRVDILLFSFATAIIMHCYSQERDVFRSKYVNVLDWVFGVPNSGIHQIKVDDDSTILNTKEDDNCST